MSPQGPSRMQNYPAYILRPLPPPPQDVFIPLFVHFFHLRHSPLTPDVCGSCPSNEDTGCAGPRSVMHAGIRPVLRKRHFFLVDGDDPYFYRVRGDPRSVPRCLGIPAKVWGVDSVQGGAPLSAAFRPCCNTVALFPRRKLVTAVHRREDLGRPGKQGLELRPPAPVPLADIAPNVLP